VAGEPLLALVIPIVRYHHEFYNGQGNRWAWIQRSIEADRTVADAMKLWRDRPHRKARNRQYILDEIKDFQVHY
jgi:HD-GYP domain-containing protein (c-di-GMP phosphodiesterase class II)